MLLQFLCLFSWYHSQVLNESQTPARSSTPEGEQASSGVHSLRSSAINPAISATPFSNTLSQPFTLKLDRHNFPLWKTMVSTIIRRHHLDVFLNGSKPCQPEFLSPEGNEEGGVPERNPDYEFWITHDQLLMGWLYWSMTEGIASEVMGCNTAASLWTALEDLYGAHSRANMDELCTKLQTTRKGAQSMAEYLRQKRMWADTLALAGEPYPDNLLRGNILSGLGPEYLSIVIPLESRITLSWQELSSTLLSFDSKLERLGTFSSSSRNPDIPAANIAQKPPSSNYNPNSPRRNNYSNGPLQEI